MFDEHLDRSHRQTYFVRGPEWAFAIPQGDLDVLEEVMKRCSTFWNGRGALLIPVTRAGRIDSALDDFLDVRPVDNCYVHEALNDQAREAVGRSVGSSSPLWDRFDDHELHPLQLLPESEGPRPQLTVPCPTSTVGGRLALACWGWIEDADRSHWEARFELQEENDEAAIAAIVSGQVDENSPLNLSARNMGIVSQRSPFDWPQVAIFKQGSFQEIVQFWNLRARGSVHGVATPVLGVPRAALGLTAARAAIRSYGSTPSALQRTPELLVLADRPLRRRVDEAMSAGGLERDDGPALRRTFGARTEPRELASYAYSAPFLGGGLVRGTPAYELVPVVRSRMSVSLPAPAKFSARGGGHVRLVLTGLPLPLPLTRSAANRMHGNALATDGLLLLTDAAERWNFDFHLPDRWAALADWASDRGFDAQSTAAGRYGEAALGRLPGLETLDTLATPMAIQVLQALTPTSRLKLVQRIGIAAADAGQELDSDKLAENLRDSGLFLEIEAKTLAQIITPGRRPEDVLLALESLSRWGFVRRGRELRCTRCGFRQLVLLNELDELVGCRSCREEIFVPIAGKGGRTEAPLAYRLDGLAARVMDQDLLPVLLTLRESYRLLGQGRLFFGWVGIEFLRKEDGKRTDADLVVSDGEHVWLFEVKSNAAGLGGEQLNDLVQLAAQLEARPCLSALVGSFTQDQIATIESASGLIFGSDQLVPAEPAGS